MTEGVVKVEAGGEGVVPQSHVLSYITTVTSATQVRRAARRFLKILGWLHVLAAVMIIGLTGWSVVEDMRAYFNDSGIPFSGPAVMGYCKDYLGFGFAFGGIFVPCCIASFGVGLLICAGTVERGSKQGCVLSMICLIPSILIGFAAAAVCGSVGLLVGFGLYGAQRDVWQLGWLLLVPVLAIVLVALWDLWNFLDWIMRNPAAEKPKVAFLS